MVSKKTLKLLKAYRTEVRNHCYAREVYAAGAAEREQQAKVDLMRHIAVMEQALIETRRHLRSEALFVAEVCERVGLED